MNTLRNIRKTGSVLVLVVCVMVILIILGAWGFLGLGMHSRIFASRDASTIAARSAADAGLTRICYECNVELSRIRRLATTWANWNMPQGQTSCTLENCEGATYDYKTPVNIVSNAPWRGLKVSSTGYYHGAKSDPCALLLLGGSTLDNAIFTETFINMENNNIVTWDQATWPKLDPPLKIGTNGTGPGSISMGNNTDIYGNASIGPGGNLATDVSGASAIKGQLSVASAPVPLDSITVPADITWTLQPDITGSQTIPGGYYQYNSIDLSSTGGTILINGNATLYVTGDIKLWNKAELAIPAGSSLTLYLGGNMDMDKNNITLGTIDPNKFLIFGLDTCTSIQIKNNPTVCAAIYAPKAAVEFKNNGNIIGAITAKSFYEKNNGTFYYDPRLRSLINIPGVHFVLRGWTETSSWNLPY